MSSFIINSNTMFVNLWFNGVGVTDTLINIATAVNVTFMGCNFTLNGNDGIDTSYSYVTGNMLPMLTIMNAYVMFASNGVFSDTEFLYVQDGSSANTMITGLWVMNANNIESVLFINDVNSMTMVSGAMFNNVTTTDDTFYLYGNATIMNSVFMNSMLTGGNSIVNSINYGAAMPNMIMLTNVNFTNNNVGYTLYSTNPTTLMNSNFMMNMGGVYIEANMNNFMVMVSGCMFWMTMNSDGALYINSEGVTSMITVMNSQFMNNTAVDGAALQISSDGYASMVTVTNSQFMYNNATTDGTAIYFDGLSAAGVVGAAHSTINIMNCMINYNWGNYALYLLDGWTMITGTMINNNMGGGFEFEDMDNVTMSGSTIMNNMGGSYGGGIYAEYFEQTTSAIMLMNVNITGNTGVYAGGVYFDNYGATNANMFTMTNCMLSGNMATFTGYTGINNELYCYTYSVAGTICACKVGFDFNQNCLNCFSDLYGTSCTMACPVCKSGQACNSGILGTGLCIASKSTTSSMKSNGMHSTVSATLLFASVVISIVLKFI